MRIINMKNISKRVMAGSSKAVNKNWAKLTRLNLLKTSLLTKKVAETCIY